MSETKSPETATTASGNLSAAPATAALASAHSPVSAKTPQKLDDVLLAMDVVDTLRHREQMVSLELDSEAREAELLQRLKDIYTAQGIEVPERILKDGVRALEERRFTYEPRTKGLSVALARAYVNRSKWLSAAGAGIGAIAAAVLVWQFVFVQPSAAEWRRLPVEIAQLSTSAEALAIEGTVDWRIEAIARAGEGALARGDRSEAKEAREELEEINQLLQEEYDLRVVSRPGEDTGFYRIPDNAPLGRNYYLVVEPVSPGGRVLNVPVFNEETQKREAVSRWAQRVSEETFKRIAEDKAPDQIIQNDVLGHKPRGVLEPQFDEPVPGEAITKW